MFHSAVSRVVQSVSLDYKKENISILDLYILCKSTSLALTISICMTNAEICLGFT